MSAEEFREKVENGEVLVDSHDLVLRIAFVYADVGIWDGNGVFDVVDRLHARGWSFGQGALKFNRYDLGRKGFAYLPNPNPHILTSYFFTRAEKTNKQKALWTFSTSPK